MGICGSKQPEPESEVEDEYFTDFKGDMKRTVEGLFSEMSLASNRKTSAVMDTAEKMVFNDVVKRVSASNLNSVRQSLNSFSKNADSVHDKIAAELKRNNYVTGGIVASAPSSDSRDSRIIKKQMDLDMGELRNLANVVTTQMLTEEVVRATKDFWRNQGQKELLSQEIFEEIVNKILLNHTLSLFQSVHDAFTDEYRQRAKSLNDQTGYYYDGYDSDHSAPVSVPPSRVDSAEGEQEIELLDAV